MPKKKKAGKMCPPIDMTPFVDTLCVVLTFLMLTAQMRQPEPVTVETPFSTSERLIPDYNLMVFLLAQDGKIFMNIDNGHDTLLKFRPRTLEAMGELYGIEFTEDQLRAFETFPSSIGVDINQMRAFLDQVGSNSPDMALIQRLQAGIPTDSADNQLSMWILAARQVNPGLSAAIRGDNDTRFEDVERLLDILQDRNVNRFNLITSLYATSINLDDID